LNKKPEVEKTDKNIKKMIEARINNRHSEDNSKMTDGWLTPPPGGEIGGHS